VNNTTAVELLTERLEQALRTIHGDVVPLPNRPSAAEYAAMIVKWMPIVAPSQRCPDCGAEAHPETPHYFDRGGTRP
jgi:hypothetical protein